ncbi:MAG: hypothetical protein V3V78_00575 [Candidatus Woesearchaeota archaeon]
MKYKKTAQMEIMGLAIIVILLSLAILFTIQFIILKEPSETKQSFTSKQLAANTASTLLTTTTGCSDQPISALLIDCAESSLEQCSGMNHCTYVKQEIQEILNSTLDKWNRKYYLTVNTDTTQIAIGEECSGEKTTSQPCCILPTKYKPVKINLDICN